MHDAQPGPAPSPFQHLQDWPDATPDDHRAFDAYMRDWAGHIAMWLPLFFLAVLFVWWPIDHLVAPDAAFVEVFRDMRATAAVAFLVYAAVFRFSAAAREHILLTGSLAYAFALAVVGYSLGRLGPAGLHWLADAYIAVVPAAMIPLPLARRVAATVVVTGALPASYFLLHPENLTAPGAAGQISFAAFAVVLSILIGEVMLRTVRRSFLQGRSIARERARVSQLADTLALRVQDQTRELRALAQHLQQVQDAERRSLSRELHSELGEELNAMRVMLDTGARQVEVAPHKAGDLLTDLSEVLSRTTQTVRTMVLDLQPRILEERGLHAALNWLVIRARGAELDATLQFDPDVERALDMPGKVAVFRCVQEAIANTLRHAEARLLRVEARAERDAAVVSVEDDGVGVDPTRLTAGFGLQGLRERLRALGGTLEVAPLPDFGTRLTARVPMNPAAREP